MSHDSEGAQSALLSALPGQPASVSGSSDPARDDNAQADAADQLLVFDSNSDADSQIGLSFRQQSFVSIEGNIVSKGGESFASIRPTRTVPLAEVCSAGEEEDADEGNQQVRIVKELMSKNRQRWEQIGYKSPPDLISLTRAKTMAAFSRGGDEGRPLGSFLGNVESAGAGAAGHRRCGSDGMELGEASSALQKMSRALMLGGAPAEARDAPPLFYGHLGEIIAGYDRVIIDAVRTGNLSAVEDPVFVYRELDRLKSKCIKEFWVDEASYLMELMDGLDVSARDAAGDAEADAIRRRAEKSRAKYERLIAEARVRGALAEELLREEYEYQQFELEAAHEASKAMYRSSRVSQEIAEKKERARQLMRDNDNERAQRIIAEIRRLEKQKSSDSTGVSAEQFAVESDCLGAMYELDLKRVQFRFQSVVRELEERQKEAQEKYRRQIQHVERYAIALPMGEPKYTPRKSDMLAVQLPKRIARGGERLENFLI